ncbi:phosphate ABC transporter substrate-binding protein PstS [Paraferrimonas sedimenticola]|uniref:Phosphate-binding protein PstS n=1 Tax=Paraferrimonas sedimenticola TaxID=375674 RepID=A0AA37RUE0_9GAMM|nr:phosphate ABC transporter substrate-binding protein PstS [Paraferrimonas sedimenticola]GLP95039.1 phosphate-binding protein [Paraferrimonas sedimenticola]
MKPIGILLGAALSAALLITPAQASAETRLQGSGASFPFPIYSKWFRDYSRATDGVRVDYQSKGSGAGISDFTNQVVDFAGSDAAMNDKELANVKDGAVILPVTAGQVVLTYNLPGVSELKLPRDVYPLIFTGEITKWNDERIAAANPGVKLPNRDITVVVRADSSGTTYVFTGHLAKVNGAFADSVGQGKAPQWPRSSRFVKSPKNDGITATVKQTPGAIGYIEYGYAKLTKMPTIKLENAKGNFIAPGAESGAQALATADFPEGNLPNSDIKDLRAWVYDPTGADAYPIASFTWVIFPQTQDAAKAKAARDLVEYMITDGQKSADAMGYIPLPKNVVEMVRAEAQKIR